MFQIKMKYMVDNFDWSNRRQNVHLSMAFDVRTHKFTITHKSGIPGSILASDDCLCKGSRSCRFHSSRWIGYDKSLLV